MKSVEELRLSGNYREDRHGDQVEGIVPIGAVIPPSNLNQIEAEIFNEVVEKMVKTESMAELDIYAIEQYCVQLALFRKAKAELEKSGEYITPHTNKSGATNLIPSPWLTVLKNTSDCLLKLSAKLGMTPADRRKVSKVGKNNDPDEMTLIK